MRLQLVIRFDQNKGRNSVNIRTWVFVKLDVEIGVVHGLKI